MEGDIEKGDHSRPVETKVLSTKTSVADLKDPRSEKEPSLTTSAGMENGDSVPRQRGPIRELRPSVYHGNIQNPRPRSPVYGRPPSIEIQADDRPRSRSPVLERGLSIENPTSDRPRSRSPVYGRGPSIEDLNTDRPQPPSPVYGRGPSLDVPHDDRTRPPSPVYGFPPSLDFEALRRNGTPSVYDPERPVSFDGQQGVVHYVPNSHLPDNTARGNLPDFTWILHHHNKELVSEIKLQEPGQSSRLFDAVKHWRPWTTHGGKRAAAPASQTREEEHSSFRISIAELHRMRMRKLQCKLASHAWYMKRFNEEPRGWEDDLQAYTKALQEYDYMTKCSTAQRDSFLISGERKVDDYVMRHVVGVTAEVLKRDGRLPIPVAGPWEEQNVPIGGTRGENVKKSWARAFERRLVMAALGGTFLVGPMWLMVLHNTLYTALISTTLFVYAFGFLMSMMLEKPMEVLSGTAAYAAVLVVFVGLGTSNNASA